MSDVVKRLRDADYRGPMQHLRAWDELDRMHDEAADEIERLRGAVANAIEIAIRYGGTDGEHHKTWVIDQMIRSLTHCPKVNTSAVDYKGNAYEYERLGESQEYTQLIANACAGEDGPETYAWDCGIAP